jgi:hypothetical protein
LATSSGSSETSHFQTPPNEATRSRCAPTADLPTAGVVQLNQKLFGRDQIGSAGTLRKAVVDRLEAGDGVGRAACFSVHHGFVRVCARNVIDRPRCSAPHPYKGADPVRSPPRLRPGPAMRPPVVAGATYLLGSAYRWQVCHAQFEVHLPPVHDFGFGASHHRPGRRSRARHHFARHQRATTATVTARPTTAARPTTGGL